MQFLNNCRIGKLTEEDIEYMQKRVCGSGHSITKECVDFFNTTNLVSIHVNRKRCLDRIESNKKNREEIIKFEARDSDKFGNKISEYVSVILNKQQGIFERTLKIFQNSEIMLIKNLDAAKGIVNGLSRHLCRS